jgi:hypothetical protein
MSPADLARGHFLANAATQRELVDSAAIGTSVESHIAIGHILCELIEEVLYGAYSSAGAGSC